MSDKMEIRRHIDSNYDLNARINFGYCIPPTSPLRYALESDTSPECILMMIDAGADPHKCGIKEEYLPKYWFEFVESRASVRSCAILAMGAMHKKYGKDVARIIGRVIWETRGITHSNAKKIKI